MERKKRKESIRLGSGAQGKEVRGRWSWSHQRRPTFKSMREEGHQRQAYSRGGDADCDLHPKDGTSTKGEAEEVERCSGVKRGTTCLSMEFTEHIHILR